MCSRIEPAAERFFGLFAERQRDAEPAAVELLDFAHGVFDEIDPARIAPLSGLQHDRTVAELGRVPRRRHDLFEGHREAGDLSVPAADAAVEAVFAADVRYLDEPAQPDLAVDVPELDLISGPVKRFEVAGLLEFEQERKPGRIERFTGDGRRQNIFENHDATFRVLLFLWVGLM